LLKDKKELHLEGRLEGNIKADWLTVGQKAEIETNKVTIWGKVTWENCSQGNYRNSGNRDF